MAVYGVGAGVPLLALGAISRSATARWRPRLMSAASAGRTFLGAALVALGLVTLSGLDHRLEGWALQWAPAWLESIVTKY